VSSVHQVLTKTSPSPYQLSDPRRLRAVHEHGFREGAPRSDLRWVTGLARRALRAEASVLTVLDSERQHVLADTAQEHSKVPVSVPLSHSLCRFVVQRDAPLVVHDARRHRVLADHAVVTELGVVTYAGVPVRAPGGEVLGALCVVGTISRCWSAEDLTDLERLAQVIRHELARTSRPQRAHRYAG
jgi:GAF domain-containing protein